jgi:WXXGXW repeat (2 copies)
MLFPGEMRRLLLLLAIGCGGRGNVAGTATIIYREPPAAQVEQVSSRPGFVWVKGHWDYRQNGWKWISGRWERDRPGYVWEEGRWEQRGNAWHWIEGHWGTGSRVARVEPETPKATAAPVTKAHPIYPTVAPPPVRVESPGSAPQADFVWIPGNWEWRTGQWSWNTGHWEHKHPDMVWVRGRWELQGNYFVWVEGRWEKPRH